MRNDPLLEEVRQLRDAYAARLRYDMEAIVAGLKDLEQHCPARAVLPVTPEVVVEGKDRS